MYLLFLLLIALTTQIQVNPNPGIKMAMNQKTMNYVMTQSLSWMEQHINTLHIPDIHENEKTPIGTLEFSITNFKLGDITPGSPSIQVQSDYLQFHDPKLNFKMSGNWKWEDKSFPWPSDSGTFDLSCDVDVTSNVGAVVDSSKKPGIRFDSNYFSITFNSLDITVHGGASWLYNVMIEIFKPIFEAVLTVAIQDQLPGIIVTVCTEAVDILSFDMTVIDNVDFSFVSDEISFDQTHQMIYMGVEGKFHTSQIVYPSEPEKMPDVLTYDPMCTLFLSEYSVNSAGYVFDKSGLIKFVLTQSEIPPKVPIKLNTSSFELIIPELYKRYPNKKMQITLDSDPSHCPSVSFSSDNAMTMFFDFDTIFQVILDNGTIVDAFTLSLDLFLKGNLSVEDVGVEKQKDDDYVVKYKIIGSVMYLKSNMTVIQSSVGKINLLLLDKMIGFLLHYIIIPLINEKIQVGIPLPAIPYFHILNPEVQYHDNYAELNFDFTFEPPEE